MDYEFSPTPDESSLSVLTDEDASPPDDIREMISSAIRAGFRDLRRSRFLAVSTAVTSLIAALAVMSGPLLSQLVSAGEASVTRDSEVIVFIDGDVSDAETERVVVQISKVRGVESIEPSTGDDLAALPPRMQSVGGNQQAYTLHPTGFVRLEDIQTQLSSIPEVRNAVLALGSLSMATIELAGELVPWLAVVAVVFGLLMMATLAFMSGHTRAAEVRAMSLVGGSRLTSWLSVSTVVVVPSLVVALIVGVAVPLIAPWVASVLLPAEAAAQISGVGLIPTAIILVVGAGMASAALTFLGTTAVRRA